MLSLLGVFLLSLLVSLFATPMMRIVSLRFGLVDKPDGHRKLHRDAIPLSGGVPILLAVAAAVVFIFLSKNSWQSAVRSEWQFFASFALAAIVVAGVGIMDDYYALRGRQKLFGQVIAVMIVMFGGGLVISKIALFGHPIELGMMAVPFTLFWVLGCINAFNLIDGIDGLASSVGIMVSLALGGLAVMNNHGEYAVIAFALGASLCGFLVYNFPPARIFLGDAGSMLIGLCLAVVGIKSATKSAATVALVAPTAIMTIPIFDVSMAILRRKLTGRSLYETDRGHMHHCLMRKSNSNRRVLAWVGGLCFIVGAGTLFSIKMGNDFIAAAAAVVALLVLVLTRSFGHAELALLGNRLQGFAVSVVSSPQKNSARELITRFQGGDTWKKLWRSLVTFGEHHDIESLELSINLPSHGEEHHATWARNTAADQREVLRTEVPLFHEGATIGRLKITGVASGSIAKWFTELTGQLRPFEALLAELLDASVTAPIEEQKDTIPTPKATSLRIKGAEKAG